MLSNEIKDFVFHEFKTDADSFVKDLANVLALGNYTKEVKDVSGNLMRKSLPSKEDCWNIVYPNPNFKLIKDREISSFDEINASEYEIITKDQISKITDSVVVRAVTRPSDRITQQTTKVGSDEISKYGLLDNDIEENTVMYLEVYFPKYLCDTELDDPTQQRDGKTVPKVVNLKTGVKDAQARNYHNCYMRIFDNPNKDYSGPAENVIDMVTGDIAEFNSASSEWCKLSWFTDFDEKFKSELGITGSDALLRIPITSSLNNKTKIRVLANIHPNRVLINVTGNPNVDYEDNRYLVGQAYIGSIDSFDFAKKDIAGNFGIFTTSSSVPSIPKFNIKYSEPFNGVNTLGTDGGKTSGKSVISNAGAKSAWVNIGTFPWLNNSLLSTRPVDTVIKYTYNRRDVPRDFGANIAGGKTTIYEPSLQVTIGASVNNEFVSEFGLMNPNVRYNNGYGTYYITANARTSISRERVTFPSELPITIDKPIVKDMTVEVQVTYNEQDLYNYIRKYVAQNDGKGLLNDLSYYIYGSQDGMVEKPIYFYLGFDEVEERTTQEGGSNRDKYGNLVDIKYHQTYGVHTANGTTDFAMYKTDSADYFQSHYFMFSSTEQFMKKHMYGKSVYTNEYFADRIKIVHSAEGVRGALSGMIVIDAESLFPFDELIVNKTFEKYEDKPEETYIYLPLTTPYTPFANSPNERYGVGILKELKYNESNDDSKCEAALREIQDMYKDIYSCTNNEESVYFADKTNNRLEITWDSSDTNIVSFSKGADIEEPTVELKISPENPTLSVGEKKSLSLLEGEEIVVNDKVIWTSSNEGIVTVSQNGELAGIKIGGAVITARYKSRKVQSEVNVNSTDELDESDSQEEPVI